MSEPEAVETNAPAEETKQSWARKHAEKMEAAFREEREPPVVIPEEEKPTEAAEEQVEPDESKKPPDGDRSKKLGELKMLAQSLGLKVEDGVILTKERVDFRAEQRVKREKLEAKEREFDSKREALVNQLEQRFGPYEKLKEASEKGDADSIAKFFGYKSFGHWTESFVTERNSPEAKRLRELEKTLKEREEREKQAEQQYRQQAEAQERQRKEQQYHSQLREHLGKSEDPIIAQFSQDPSFLAQIVEIQRQHFDAETRTTLSADEAAEKAIDTLRGFYQNLSVHFGNQAPTPETAPAVPPQGANGAHQGRKPPKTVSQNATADAAGEVLSGLSDEEAHRKWKEKWAQKMRAST